MLTLVTGGAASGKSEYAERLAAACDGPRVYIATMRPLDKESVARIEKHRAARADRRFSTIELYHDFKRAAPAVWDKRRFTGVYVESGGQRAVR